VANALYAVDTDTKALQMSQDSESASQTTGSSANPSSRPVMPACPRPGRQQSWLQARAASVAAKAACTAMWWRSTSHWAAVCSTQTAARQALKLRLPLTRPMPGFFVQQRRLPGASPPSGG
jgi:ferric-dicitrate binding protein FerR (iron transport regulator)